MVMNNPAGIIPEGWCLGTYYAIRHKPTGKYLPQPASRQGFSHVAPMDPSVRAPRLMADQMFARRVLGRWLMGHQDDHGDGGIRIRKDINRIREDMEIVRVVIVPQPK